MGLLTCEHRRLEQLDQLVDLNEHLYGHFQFRTANVSRASKIERRASTYKI